MNCTINPDLENVFQLLHRDKTLFQWSTSGVFLLGVNADLLIKLLSFSESVSVVSSHRHQGEHDHQQLLCLLLRMSETNEATMILLFL